MSPHQNHSAGHEGSGVKAHSHSYSHRKRRETHTQQKITQQAQFLNYITEKRQLPSSRVGSETVLVVCATLRAKHPDVFGALRFGDGSLEAYVQGCRVAVFDAGSTAGSVAFPHVLVEYERSVTAPFIVLQVRGVILLFALRTSLNALSQSSRCKCRSNRLALSCFVVMAVAGGAPR